VHGACCRPPLAAGCRHDEAGIAAAPAYRDTAHLHKILIKIAGKLAAVGVRVGRREGCFRIVEAKPATRSRDTGDTVQ
jgi:hypothetical protein